MICAFCGNPAEIASSRLCETCRDAHDAADDEMATVEVQTSANVMMSDANPLTTIMIEVGGIVEEYALREAMNAAEKAVVTSLGILKLADVPADDNSGGN